jgi:hypothetical protein
MFFKLYLILTRIRLNFFWTIPKAMERAKKTWYFVEPVSKLHDFYNILHLPYTGMVLAFVIIGSAYSPHLYISRLGAALVAFFLGLGIGAHAIDQLEPSGSRYVKHLSKEELKIIAFFSLLVASLIGIYYTFTLGWIILLFVATGLFFSLAYPLPTYFFGGLFHNRPSFAFSWGFFPFITGYFVNSQGLEYSVFFAALPIAGAAWAELTWSRKARKARREGLPEDFYRKEERKLKCLVIAVYLTAVSALLFKLFYGSVVL